MTGTSATRLSGLDDVGYTAAFDCGHGSVDVECDGADVHEWLRDFLTPWAEHRRFGQGRVRVRFTASAGPFDALLRATPSVRAAVPCFVLDRHVVTLPAWREGPDTVLADDELECFYRIGARTVDVIGRPGGLRTRFGLMRIVRDLLAAIQRSGATILDLHAAAFDVAGRSALIVGAKNAGKTTVLCYALTSGRARMIANDRVFVDGISAAAAGVPTLTAVRAGTMTFFPQLRGGGAGHPTLLYNGESTHTLEGLAQGTHVRSLSPRAFAGRLGTECVRTGIVSTIVFPEIASSPDIWEIEPLPAAEVRARLASNLCGAHAENGRRTILEEALGLSPEQPDRATLLQRLAGAVPGFSCRLGPQAYSRPAEEWLRSIGLGETSS